jgi:lysophospholipase L1-like esterase
VDGLAAVLLLTVLAAGCGGSSRPGKPVVVAALGDSITSGSPDYDPDPRMRDVLGFGSNEQSQWEYWAHKADPRLEFRNCGVYGERTDQIAARLERCAKGADVLVVQGGINDIAQGRSVAGAAVNLRAMVEQGKRLGLRVTIAELLPWNNGWPDAETKITDLNGRIHALAAAEHVPVLPFYGTLEDPARRGRMIERLTADGDHPSIEGYRLLGEKAFRLP